MYALITVLCFLWIHLSLTAFSNVIDTTEATVPFRYWTGPPGILEYVEVHHCLWVLWLFTLQVCDPDYLVYLPVVVSPQATNLWCAVTSFHINPLLVT